MGDLGIANSPLRWETYNAVKQEAHSYLNIAILGQPNLGRTTPESTPVELSFRLCEQRSPRRLARREFERLGGYQEIDRAGAGTRSRKMRY